MQRPSLRSDWMSPLCQRSSLLFRCVTWSLLLLCLLGFCRSKTCKMVLAFIAMPSRVEQSAKACQRRASSATKFFPEDPDGTRKRFLFQCITSSYAAAVRSEKTFPSSDPHRKAAVCGSGDGHLSSETVVQETGG